jgi:hypothetical protein
VTKPLEQKSGRQSAMMETEEKEPQLLEMAVIVAKEVAATVAREGRDDG